MKHVYIAHRLGAGLDREKNRQRAARWVAWAARQGVVPVATWITLSGEWDESPENRGSGLAIDFAQIERCDELWVCGDKETLAPGPRQSSGVLLELRHAGACSKPSRYRMTDDGEPPK